MTEVTRMRRFLFQKVKNSDDFEKIIRSYFPDSEITFDFIFGGNEWEDPRYGIGE